MHVTAINNEHVSIKIDHTEIESSDCEKLLGTKIDTKLNFEGHLDGVIKKTSRKVNALSRFTPYMNIAKLLLFDLMFHSRGLNNKINRLHERYIAYGDNRPLFEDLVDKDKSVSIYVKISSHPL